MRSIFESRLASNNEVKRDGAGDVSVGSPHAISGLLGHNPDNVTPSSSSQNYLDSVEI